MIFTSATLTALQERLEPNHGVIDLGLHHDVRVKDDINVPAAIEGDVLPLRESYLAALIVGAPPAIDAEERDDTAALADQRVALLDTLGDKQGHRGVAQLIPHQGMDVK